MTLYLLDTNTISYFLRRRDRTVQMITSQNYDDLCISSIVEAELRFGVERRPDAIRKARVVRQLLERVAAHPWTSKEAVLYGDLKATMERSGKSLQPLDMLIAAHAVSLGATLVTSDQAFRHVPGLTVEDWS
jgi:tRNA(fMet)-specific endonuclease VapC